MYLLLRFLTNWSVGRRPDASLQLLLLQQGFLLERKPQIISSDFITFLEIEGFGRECISSGGCGEICQHKYEGILISVGINVLLFAQQI